MTQFELDRAVALATGEDVIEIRHRGFSFVDPTTPGDFDNLPCNLPPQTIDWDELDRRRQAPYFSPLSERRQPAA